MTANGPSPTDSRNAWVRYLDREHTARDTYLTAVDHAHWQYLNGPWPDRDAYTAIERRAWTIYYAAGRAAWQQYTADMTAVPPPPPKPADPATESGWVWPEFASGGMPAPLPRFSPRPPGEQCQSRPYPHGSEGDDGTSCQLPAGHPGPHSDTPGFLSDPTTESRP